MHPQLLFSYFYQVQSHPSSSNDVPPVSNALFTMSIQPVSGLAFGPAPLTTDLVNLLYQTSVFHFLYMSIPPQHTLLCSVSQSSKNPGAQSFYSKSFAATVAWKHKLWFTRKPTCLIDSIWLSQHKLLGFFYLCNSVCWFFPKPNDFAAITQKLFFSGALD